MDYEYRIKNDEIIEISIIEGKRVETPTGVKAFYTKQEICDKYHWGKDMMRKRLEEIAPYIYNGTDEGFVTTKKVFAPFEMERILNYYGLP